MSRTFTSTPADDGSLSTSADTTGDGDGQRSSPPPSGPTGIGPIRRRTVDSVLVGLGAIAALILAVAGGLLTWGSNFADDYVGRELNSQNISFPDAAALEADGREDLLDRAGEQVSTGDEAEAFASYIGGHLDDIAGGATYADLGSVEREATSAVESAIADGAPQATVDGLQAEADAVAGQRNSLFKGETLRGLLLSTYAWSTVGDIARIASIAAFVAAGLMAVLVVLGLLHRRRSA